MILAYVSACILYVTVRKHIPCLIVNVFFLFFLFFQVEKAFREGTARQNAHSIFVCLALKLLEERVHVACKDIITLEKQVLNFVIFADKILERKTGRAHFQEKY